MTNIVVRPLVYEFSRVTSRVRPCKASLPLDEFNQAPCDGTL